MALDTKNIKNLDEAFALLEQLDQKLTNVSQQATGLATDKKLLEDQVATLNSKNAALAQQVSLLSKSVGTKEGLPKEVVADVERRMAQGLNEQEAVHAALRQHAHDKRLAAEKKAAK